MCLGTLYNEKNKHVRETVSKRNVVDFQDIMIILYQNAVCAMMMAIYISILYIGIGTIPKRELDGRRRRRRR